MKALKKKKMVNHVAFLLDASGSMMGLTNATRETFAKLMDGLASEEKKSGIETLVHIYSFGATLVNHEQIATPKEAARYIYSARNEGTALIDSTLEVVSDLKKFATAKSDVSFLVYVLTDGQETQARERGSELRRALERLNDDWTMAIMVPNEYCRKQAEAYGFPPDNIQVWEVSDSGVQELGTTLTSSTQSYYSMRACGQKSTKSLFKLNEVNKTEVKKALEEVNPGDYQTLIVRKYDDGKAIKDFVESWTKEPYRVGSAYYQLTKPEKVQAGKVVAVVDKQTGKMFSGVNARNLLGLPMAEVKVDAANFAKFDVFVQSHSTNRKLVEDTHVIVFK